MFVVNKYYNQGDGGGGQAGVHGGQLAPESAQPTATPSVPQAPLGSAEAVQQPQMDDFRARTAAYIERWRRESRTIQPEGNGQDADKRDGQSEHPAQAGQVTPPSSDQPPMAPQQQPLANQPAQQQAQGAAQPASDQTPAEQKILRLCGSDWTVEQAEQHLRYAHSALQREAEIAAKEEEFESLMKSPDVVILQELKNDPDLRAKVIELMSGEHQDAAANLAAREAQAQVAALQDQLAALRQQLQAREQEDMRREQERQYQQQMAWAQGVVNNVKGTIDSQAKTLGIPDDMVQLVGAKIKAAVESGAVPFEQQKLTEYGLGLLKTISDHISSQHRQVQEQYLKSKQQLPPPPPQGGAPALGNAAPRTFADARRRSQERISAALGEFGR